MTGPDPKTAPQDRRLAAIVFTDVVGYSALVQKDDEGTLASVRADFERMRALCAAHSGEILNTMGDGMMLTFKSALQAVAFALEMQAEFASRRGREPSALTHRVGIHVGDVFGRGGDVAGDGINIAARLQARGEPGAVCASKTTYEMVRGRLPMRAEALGPLELKNIRESVDAFMLWPSQRVETGPARWKPKRGLALAVVAVCVFALAGTIVWKRRDADGQRRPPADAATPKTAVPEASARPNSIAVLPFASMSEDKDNEYIAEGIHEDILTNLANIASLHVISRTSVLRYKGTSKPIGEIAAELGVAYILEGSVRRSGNRVRVTGQLIRAATDEHVWAKAYDGELTDVFALQAQLASTIAEQLRAVLTPEEAKRIGSVVLTDPKAYELYLKARKVRREEWNLAAPNPEAETLLRQATALDPTFALAWAELANFHTDRYFLDPTDPSLRETAKAELDRALSLAPERAEVQVALGRYYYFGFADFGNAAQCFATALRLEPSFADVHQLLGLLNRRQARWKEAIEELKRARDLDPVNPRLLGLLATTYGFVQDYPSAREATLARVLAVGEAPDRAVDIPVLDSQIALSPRPLKEWLRGLPASFRSSPPGRDAEAEVALWTGDAAAYVACYERDASSEPDLESRIAYAIAERKLGIDARPVLAKLQQDCERVVKEHPEAFGQWHELARVYALLGMRKEAEAALSSTASSIPGEGDILNRRWADVARAQVALWLGDRDEAVRQALALLREPGSSVDRYSLLNNLYWWPLQADPRIQAVLQDPSLGKPLI